ADVRAAELIVERGGPDRPLQHDLERRGDASRLADALLPRLYPLADAQMRYREAHQPRLRLGTSPGRALIANLTTRARGRPGEGRDRGRMIVGLDLHENVDRLIARAVDAAARIDHPAAAVAAADDRGIVAVGR